jgi:hypothetical protein
MSKQGEASPTSCTAMRRDGSPCHATALPGRPHCWAHDPENRDRARAAREAGGRGRSRVARAQKHVPTDLRRLVGKLTTAIEEVHAGRLEPRRAQAMASLAGALIRVYETGEMEARLDDLETRLGREARG